MQDQLLNGMKEIQGTMTLVFFGFAGIMLVIQGFKIFVQGERGLQSFLMFAISLVITIFIVVNATGIVDSVSGTF